MATYLDDIVAHHRVRAAADTRGRGEREEAAERAPAARDFVGALVRRAGPGRAGSGRAGPGSAGPERAIAVIAEVKRRSPSKGDLLPLLDPSELARSYAAGGAACLSVLTDAPHFGGSPEDLRSARGAVELPVLRKDFTVCEGDVLDARAMGADAVLLIAAVLDDVELASCAQLAGGLGMAALVEVHDEEELERALGVGAGLVGVNQRDLRSFAVDPLRAERVAAAIPDGVVRVAESGVSSAEDVARLAAAGFDAVLVGEALVTSADPAQALRELVGGAGCS